MLFRQSKILVSSLLLLCSNLCSGASSSSGPFMGALAHLANQYNTGPANPVTINTLRIRPGNKIRTARVGGSINRFRSAGSRGSGLQGMSPLTNPYANRPIAFNFPSSIPTISSVMPLNLPMLLDKFQLTGFEPMVRNPEPQPSLGEIEKRLALTRFASKGFVLLNNQLQPISAVAASVRRSPIQTQPLFRPQPPELNVELISVLNGRQSQFMGYRSSLPPLSVPSLASDFRPLRRAPGIRIATLASIGYGNGN